ncbi:MAG: hypothetical protein K2I64_04260 [Muribaculaceae bacterium]|nr:hypothetical protein [Muribaculaceae bacterium]
MKKQLLTLGVLMAASFAAFAQSASDRLDIYGKDGKFVSVMKDDVQEITVGKADSGDGYTSVSVTTPAGVQTRDIDNITEIKYSPIIKSLAHQLDTIHAPNSEVVLLDWRNNTDVYDEAQIDPSKPADWRGAWADGIVHFILRTDKGFAADFKITGEYSGKVYSDNPSFVFWSLKEISGLYCDSYAFYMPFEPVVIEAISWELDTYKDAPFLGTYSAYGLIPAENRIAVNAKADASIAFDANTTYTLKSTDKHEFDILDLYSWDEEKNSVTYVTYEGELRNEADVDVKYGLIGKFDGDFFFGTVHDILNDKMENSVSYFASRKEVEVTVAVANEYNQHILVEAKPTDGSDASYFYYDINAIYPIRLTAELASGKSIGEVSYGFFLLDGAKYLRYLYHGQGAKPELTFRGSEYGTYTGESGDLKLDGFGSCTLGDAEGTYKKDGGALTVTIGNDERYFAIDPAAKTYVETVSDPWDGQAEYTLSTARGVFRGGEPNDNNSMSVKFTQNDKGKDVVDIRFNIKRNDGFSGADGISDLCSYLYDAKNQTVVVTNVYMGTSANSSGIGTITLKVSDDKNSLWLDDTESDRLYMVGNTNSYLFTGAVNTMYAPRPIAKGSGTEEDPYQLTTAEEIEAMKEVVSTETATWFKLMNDIDMTGINHIPPVGYTGDDYGKTIHFDGNHHVISNLTSIAENKEFYYASLLGVFQGSVKDLGLVNVNLKSGLGVGGIGGYAGYDGVATTIDNCYVTGKMENPDAYAGGLAGTNAADLTITNSYAQVEVKGGKFATGLVGRGRNNITIKNTYVSGTVASSEGKTATLALVAATDKPSGVTLTLENVVAVNTGATDMTNYGTMATGTPATDIKAVKSWDAFNEGLLFNELPALNWQENAEAPKLIANGSGTEEDPYQLTTAEEIEAMKEVVSTETATWFKLMNDIDMTGINHIPPVGYTGDDYGKTIHFDGNHHIISNLTSIAENKEFYYASLLGVFQGSVKDLGLVNVNLKSGLGVGGIGGYAGYDGVATTIDNCYVTGKMENPDAYAGGLAGTNAADLTITNSYAQVEVKGGKFATGLVGRGRNNITIKNTYVSGTVASSEGKTATLALVAATDKPSGVTLTLENVVAVNTGATDMTNYGTMATGTPATDVKTVKTWDAFNKGLLFNDLPALNWQENAVEGPEDPGVVGEEVTVKKEAAEIFAEESSDLTAISPIHLNDDIDLIFEKGSGYANPSYKTTYGTLALTIERGNIVKVVGRNENVNITKIDIAFTSSTWNFQASSVPAENLVNGNSNITWTNAEGANAVTFTNTAMSSGRIASFEVTYTVKPAEPELAAKYTGAPQMDAFGNKADTEATLTFDKEAGKATLVIKGMNQTLVNTTVVYTVVGNTVTLKDAEVYDPEATVSPVIKPQDVVFTVGEDGNLTSEQTIAGSAMGMVMTIDLSSAPLVPEVTEEPEPEPVPVTELSVNKGIADIFTSNVTDLEAASPVKLNDDIKLSFEKGTAYAAPSATVPSYGASYVLFSGGSVMKFVGSNEDVKITKIDITCSTNSYTFTASSTPAETLTTTKPNIVWSNEEGANEVTITNSGYSGGRIINIEVVYTVPAEGGDEPEPTPVDPVELAAKYTGAPKMDAFGNKADTETTLTFDKDAGKATLAIKGMNQTLVNTTVVYTVVGNTVTLKDAEVYDPEATVSPVIKPQDVVFTVGEDGNLTSEQTIAGSAMGMVMTIDLSSAPLVPEVTEEPEPVPAVELAAKYTGAPQMDAFGNKADTETTLTFDKDAAKATLVIKGMGQNLINTTVDYTLEGNTVTLKDAEVYDPEATVSPVIKPQDVVFTVGEDGNLTSEQTIAGSAMGMLMTIDLSSAPLVPAE